jgi:methylated-DNA-[protein]-cysteine S-methyltransferase
MERKHMTTLHCTTWTSPLGDMVLAVSDAGVYGAWFEGQRHFAGREEGWRSAATHPLLRETMRQLQAYFDGRLRAFELPIAPDGTPFQQAVWRAIATVPYGATLTYAALASVAGAPGAARAAGAATGRNPVSIIVPCHRIVGMRGALTGYAGGLDRKRALLGLESGTSVRNAA